MNRLYFFKNKIYYYSEIIKDFELSDYDKFNVINVVYKYTYNSITDGMSFNTLSKHLKKYNVELIYKYGVDDISTIHKYRHINILNDLLYCNNEYLFTLFLNINDDDTFYICTYEYAINFICKNKIRIRKRFKKTIFTHKTRYYKLQKKIYNYLNYDCVSPKKLMIFIYL